MIKITSFSAILLIFCGFAACKQDTNKKTDANALPPIQYEPLPQLSEADSFRLTTGKVMWVGSKTLGAKHNGIAPVSAGTFYVKNGRLVGLRATVDLNAITVEDLTDSGEKSDFLSHMKSADFFDTKKYPTATFELVDNLPNPNLKDYPTVITGNLTIKGITKQVNVPVQTQINGNSIKILTAGFVINRTDFGINFGSSLVGTAKDKLIDDYISLNLVVEASK
jgi:YceI-like domain